MCSAYAKILVINYDNNWIELTLTMNNLTIMEKGEGVY